MCHPVVISLADYDRDYQTDLLKVLYTYLRQNCSLAHTAQAMNYHRNTILNKVNKIQEVTGINLSDAEWPEVLLFSCVVYEFMNQTW